MSQQRMSPRSHHIHELDDLCRFVEHLFHPAEIVTQCEGGTFVTPMQAVILGAVQGVTEFLPISSSGHLVLLQQVWHIHDNNLLFVSVLHVATLFAVVYALRAEVRQLLRQPWNRTTGMIVLALIPTAVVGALFEELFEHLFASGMTIGLEFIVTGIILWWMDSVANGQKDEHTLAGSDALWIGLWQGVAILPALSRSGLTMAAGLWRGMDREAAGRFSFLLSIPAILGATAVTVDDAIEAPLKSMIPMPVVLVGGLAAVITGYLSVHATLWLLKRAKMRLFACYAFAVAGFVLTDQLFLHHWFPALIH